MKKALCLILVLMCAVSFARAGESTLPMNLTEIGDEAFRGDTSLHELILPDGVWRIGLSAFEDCANLSEIHIPSSVKHIGDQAFDGCAADFRIICEKNSYAALWSDRYGIRWELPEKPGLHAYINQYWLDCLGLSTPATVEELVLSLNIASSYDPNGNGISDETGLAACSIDDFIVAFRALDPNFETEKLYLMLAAGEISDYEETDSPFSASALVVISDSLPAEYSGEYVLLEAGDGPFVTPAPTASPTPRPTDGLHAYINQYWLDCLGLSTPATVEELVLSLNIASSYDSNGNGISDETGLAARSIDDFIVAFRALDPNFETEKLYLMLAAGEISDYEETDSPFSASSLVVISDSLPAVYSGEYVLLEAGDGPFVTPAPTASPTPRPTDGLHAYINQYWLDCLGLPTPVTVEELLWLIDIMAVTDPNGNGISDETGLAALAIDDFIVAFRALDPNFETEKLYLMLAAGEISDYEETDSPFSASALVVISDSLPAVYSGEYVLLG